MDKEKNIYSILALEKQIEECEGHEKTTVRLKRARNSLLNVSTLIVPEVLGSIFCWNVITDGEFGGLPKGSYNFLLVCHHWFEVASCTPELWSFWGNSIRDWTHRHVRCGTAPLDLVLDGDGGQELGDQLRDALRDRAARDSIRQVHLSDHSGGQPVLTSVISSIVVEGEETRSSSVESFIVKSGQGPVVDASPFFSRYHLPKLHRLHLSGCSFYAPDLLKSRITTLTTLRIASELSTTPPPSKLLPILSSNPLLQDLSLSLVPNLYAVDDNGFSLPVPLFHLEYFHLRSYSFNAAFWLLNRLELPDKMNNLDMLIYGCSSPDVTQTLGPYFGDRIRRRGGFPGGRRRLSVKYSRGDFNLFVENAHSDDGFPEEYWLAKVHAYVDVSLTDEEAVGKCFDFIAHIPLEQITEVQTNLPILRSEELCVGMCNLTYLHLLRADLSGYFADPDIRGLHTFRELLPSLNHLKINGPPLGGDQMGPLTNFLTRRAAVGNRISLFVLISHPQLSPEVVESIERAVGVFERRGMGWAHCCDHNSCNLCLLYME